jgi:2,3-dihydroxybenzoate-AMP ligase/mycobactin salicyl-AMP ligase
MSQPCLGLTIGDLPDRLAGVQPHQVALVNDEVRLTRVELRERIHHLAAAFLDLGIAKGDTVLIQLPNWAEFVYSYFALQDIGAVPVLLISGHGKAEVKHLCRLTGAKAWIVPAAYRGLEYASWTAEVKADNPQLAHVVSVRTQGDRRNFTGSLEELMSGPFTRKNLSASADRCPKQVDLAHILPSGGTTGLPKAIPRTHGDYLSNVYYLHQAGNMQLDDVCLLVVPVGHNLALLNVVGAMLVGYRLVLLDSTRPADICRAIEVEKVTYFPAVPSLIHRVLQFEKRGDFDLTSLKKISAGGEPSPVELVERVRRELHCLYIKEFGMTEGLLCRTRRDDKLETLCATVGKPVCPNDEIKILNEEGRELPAETDGELATKGPGIFAGYLNNPEENRRAFTADGFFRTGDLARIDRSGNLTITGRIKDVINRGGEKISPAQVEALLLSHPQIADAAAIGMPDASLGEKVCAYVRSAADKKPSPAEIKAFLESKGASTFLIPERFEFVDTLPLTEAGKHDKKALREDIRRKLGIR